MQHLLDDCGKICLCLRIGYLVEVHEYCDKRCLSVCSHECDDLILNHLHTAVDFFLDTEFCDLVDFFFIQIKSNALKLLAHLLSELFTADLYKWCQMCKRDTLSTIL